MNSTVEKNRVEKKISLGAVVASAKQVYDGSVTKRALARAGKCKNLKGHVTEILTCDRINTNPKNIITGTKAVLTKSNTAIRDDIVVKKGGKVIQRFQVKDTPSVSGVRDTVKRVAEGQYKGTKLIGTKETAKEYVKKVASENTKGANITQKMATNGIRSSESELIAKKALGGQILDASTGIAKEAGKSSVTGGAISGALEAVSSGKECYDGKITVGKAAANVAEEAAIGGVSAMAGDIAGSTATIAVAATPAAPAAPFVGTVVSMAVGTGMDKGIRKAESMTKEYAKKVTAKKREKKELEAFNERMQEKRAGRIIGNKRISKKMEKRMNDLSIKNKFVEK